MSIETCDGLMSPGLGFPNRTAIVVSRYLGVRIFFPIATRCSWCSTAGNANYIWPWLFRTSNDWGSDMSRIEKLGYRIDRILERLGLVSAVTYYRAAISWRDRGWRYGY